eukprot:11976238-Alexandrium_andersonii.AAC.1
MPSLADVREKPKFGPKAVPGVFLGYVCARGLPTARFVPLRLTGRFGRVPHLRAQGHLRP